MTAFWRTWLRVWCYATAAFGLMFAAAAFPPFDAGAIFFYDLVYWPLDGESSFADNVRFTCALMGAVTFGWALTIFAMVDAAEALGSRAWRALTMSLLAWYAIDSFISVYSGVWMNAVSNTGLMAGYLAPVLASGVLTERGAATP